jgi:hypothetical protein
MFRPESVNGIWLLGNANQAAVLISRESLSAAFLDLFRKFEAESSRELDELILSLDILS